MVADDTKTVKYSSCDVVDGIIRILFAPSGLGVNVNDCLEPLPAKMNEATQPAGADGKVPVLGPLARLSVSKHYNEQIKPELEKLKKWFSPEFKLNPMWDENYAVMKKTPKKDLVSEDWEDSMGRTTLSYFEGVTYYMDWKNFKEDDMLQEGFNDTIDKHEIALRVVEKLKKGSGYNECVIENGVLYLQVSCFSSVSSYMIADILQTTPKTWGVNVNDAASDLLGLL
jgi:hypothetical protein